MDTVSVEMVGSRFLGRMVRKVDARVLAVAYIVDLLESNVTPPDNVIVVVEPTADRSFHHPQRKSGFSCLK